MNRQIGSIVLVSGTCIGAGIVALPIALAKVGILPSTIIMLIVWFFIYHTSLFSVELNLQAGQGLDISKLSKRISGNKMYVIALLTLKILSYSLLIAYLAGFTSVFNQLILAIFNITLDSTLLYISIFCIILFSLSINIIEKINRLLFAILIICFVILISYLIATENFQFATLIADDWMNFHTLRFAVLIIFYSFGFQVIFHTLVDFCEQNAAILKKALFYGTLLPAIIYTTWIYSALNAIANHDPIFYHKMVFENTSVGDFVSSLAEITELHSIQMIIWLVTLLAILTSIIGVGLGLRDSIQQMLAECSIVRNISSQFVKSQFVKNFTISVIMVAPIYIMTIVAQDAFLKILSFAGMLIAIVGILIPIYLLIISKPFHNNYPILKNKILLVLSIIFGFFIIMCEILNFDFL